MADELDTRVPTEGLETATQGESEVDEGFDPNLIEDDNATGEGEEVEGEQEQVEGAEEEGEGDEGSEEEFIDINVNGKAYKVPKELEALAHMQRDYTQKTQSIADERRQLESDKEWINQTKQATSEELQAVANLQALDGQLAQFAQTDWKKLEQDDWAGAQSKWREYQQMKDLKSQWENHLGGLRQQRTQAEQQRVARQLEQTANWAKSNIKGWSPDMAEKLVSFGEELGIKRDNLKREMSPAVLNMLHLAYLGKQAQSKIPSKATAKKVVQPLKTVQAKTSPRASGDLSRMSMEEFIAARNKGVGG